ncbi:hypothetical protein NIES4071_101040 (plasmid) [Calothrix sp. NIES-4071]|nr:hypothetical protein NIES4071_101040 [Calothrix sp. NIES-4071]BAZ64485.1 hypothetical protein NIES4105_102180 [Calothrix sp. NIES-4105]
MAVYSQPRKGNDLPVLQPTVQAINAEKYQGIPGADVVFPKTGLYQLELGCQPKTEGDFRAFQLKYDVTVAAGADIKTPQPEKVSDSQTKIDILQTQEKQSWNIPMLTLAGLFVLGIVGIIARTVVKRQN